MCQSIASILKSRRTHDTTELGKGLEESGHFPKRVTCNINNVVNDLEFGRSLD
jgi:hypothetical protein